MFAYLKIQASELKPHRDQVLMRATCKWRWCLLDWDQVRSFRLFLRAQQRHREALNEVSKQQGSLSTCTSRGRDQFAG